ncbi:hypothetical protein FRB96_008952 [Tulasnella sp. 330]|nr:hypothetical protein FRB96_008952 [Tulasnella sp. 330]
MPPRAARLQQNKTRASPAISVDNSHRNGTTGAAGESVTSTIPKKRTAAAAGVGEAAASKRKRTDNLNTVNAEEGKGTTSNGKSKANGGGSGSTNVDMPGGAAADGEENEEGKSTGITSGFLMGIAANTLPASPLLVLQFDFTTLPLPSLQAYILKYDLLPTLSPFVIPSTSPSSSRSFYPPAPPLPYHLLNPLTLPPPPPPPVARSVSPTPANRPRRRRSTRLGDDTSDGGSTFKEPHGNPVHADEDKTRQVLAEIARRHWERMNLKESDVVEAFSWSLRYRGRLGPP